MDNEETTAQRLVIPAQNEETSNEQPTTPNSTTEVASQETQPAQPGDEIAVPSSVPAIAQNTDDSTQQIPMQPADGNSATIQVPAMNPAAEAKSESAPTASAPTSIPFMDSDDLLTLKIVSDPQISPDGRWIAFTSQHCNAEENTTGSSIWMVNNAGGKGATPRQLTDGENHDTFPRWSSDGSQLAFLSDRTGTNQIYLLPMSGGEALQFSFLRQGVAEYSWRPDGQAILAHSSWKPQDERNISTLDPITSVYLRLDNQKDGKGYTDGRHKQLWLLSLAGDAQRITSEPVDLEQSCWSPNGQQVVFCANRRQDPDLSDSKALWVLTLATGQMQRLTPEDGQANMPAWSPDGKSIAYLYSAGQSEAGNISPWIVDVQGNALPRLAVQGADTITCQTWIIDELRSEWLAKPEWYPDSQALLVPVQEHGQVHLYQLNLATNSMQRLTTGNGRYISPQISKNGQMIAMVRADWFTPGDIWSMENASKQLRKLTRVNDAILQSHQLIRPRRITWQSFDGLEIEGLLYLPQSREGAPLILAPHGGPALAWGDGYVHEFQVLAGRGYAVFAPNPRGSAGYGEEFSHHVLEDWGGADFHDLMVGLDHIIATEPIDRQRLGVGGMSYGGYMTNWMITQSNRFKAAVSRNGISSLITASLLADQAIWYSSNMSDEKKQVERSPLTHVDAIETPLLLLHAEDDLGCPFSESMQLFAALRKRKRSVELVRYRHASHLMDWPTVGTPQQRVDRLRRTIQWFERFL